METSEVLYIYGAADAGREFYKSNTLVSRYNRVFFVDREKGGSVVDGIEIISPEKVDAGDMIITNCQFTDVMIYYADNGRINIIGIYIRDTKKVVSYKEACFEKRGTFYNHSALRWEKKRRLGKEERINRYLEKRNLFDAVGTINFELSNLCNYSGIHKMCPISQNSATRVIMPIKNIKSVITELAKHKYEGAIGFYIYNEPLIDPRLFYIINLVKNELPKCSVEITTNAYYFNQTMLDELFDINCDRVTASAYGEEEYKRLMSYDSSLAYMVYYSRFDDRLKQYEESGEAKNSRRCSSFVDFVGISCDGELYLCCMDYKKSFNLGNVFEMGLEHLMNNERIMNITDNLLNGNRRICNLCKNCEMDF